MLLFSNITWRTIGPIKILGGLNARRNNVHISRKGKTERSDDGASVNGCPASALVAKSTNSRVKPDQQQTTYSSALGGNNRQNVNSSTLISLLVLKKWRQHIPFYFFLSKNSTNAYFLYDALLMGCVSQIFGDIHG